MALASIEHPIEGWRRKWCLSYGVRAMIQAANARGLHSDDGIFQRMWETIPLYQKFHKQGVTWWQFVLGINDDDELEKVTMLIVNRIADHTDEASVKKVMAAYKASYGTLNFN